MSNDIFLASSSPRRAELLQQIGICFQRCAVDIDETPIPGESANDYVCRLATEKARAAHHLVARKGAPVLGADTIVVLNGAVLGKPNDDEHARQMLARLSNTWHEVLTAVTVIGEGVDSAQARVEQLCSLTRVHMRELTENEVVAYGQHEAVLDKAGAYAVQGIAASFIDRIEGSYSGVMGLPLYETSELLRRFGINVLSCD